MHDHCYRLEMVAGLLFTQACGAYPLEPELAESIGVWVQPGSGDAHSVVGRGSAKMNPVMKKKSSKKTVRKPAACARPNLMRLFGRVERPLHQHCDARGCWTPAGSIRPAKRCVNDLVGNAGNLMIVREAAADGEWLESLRRGGNQAMEPGHTLRRWMRRVLGCAYGQYPWDDWERAALAVGVSKDLAGLGRLTMREAYQHQWDDRLKSLCGWRDEGTAHDEAGVAFARSRRKTLAAAARHRRRLARGCDAQTGQWISTMAVRKHC